MMGSLGSHVEDNLPAMALFIDCGIRDDTNVVVPRMEEFRTNIFLGVCCLWKERWFEFLYSRKRVGVLRRAIRLLIVVISASSQQQ
jgi:hypothetical protein